MSGYNATVAIQLSAIISQPAIWRIWGIAIQPEPGTSIQPGILLLNSTVEYTETPIIPCKL